jgi:CTD nuclear envelope phosphatase 1
MSKIRGTKYLYIMMMKKDDIPRKNSLSDFINIEEANASTIRHSKSKQQSGNPLFKSHSVEISSSSKHQSSQIAYAIGDVSDITQDEDCKPQQIPSKPIPIQEEREDSESSEETASLMGQLGLLDDVVINDFEQIKEMVVHQEERGSSFFPAKPILCLDLDETLIFTVSEGRAKSYISRGALIIHKVEGFYILCRPYLELFLKEMRKIYELRVFTASEEKYATQIIKAIDPNGYFFSKAYYRQSCRVVSGKLVKDLRVLECDLSRVALMDNSVISFSMQMDNGVAIKPFFGCEYDTELADNINFMKDLSVCDDLRQKIHDKWNLKKLLQFYKEL